MEQAAGLMESPQKLLDQAAMQIFRGPATDASGIPNLASVMGAHSLLDDIYGNNWLVGTVTGPPIVANDKWQRRCTVVQRRQHASANRCCSARRLRADDYEPLSGVAIHDPSYGQSTRIVALVNTVTGVSIRAPGYSRCWACADGSAPQQNDTFIVNGVPFSGTGFGYARRYDGGRFAAERAAQPEPGTDRRWRQLRLHGR